MSNYEQKSLIATSSPAGQISDGSTTKSGHSKWRITVSIGVVLAMTVCVANIALLAWAKSAALDFSDGVATVFEGP
jgi:hypothetical protein